MGSFVRRDSGEGWAVSGLLEEGIMLSIIGGGGILLRLVIIFLTIFLGCIV